MTATVLEISDLRHSFGSTVAVNNLSFSAPAGEVTTLLGRNGAGKTTTIDACLGLISGWSGSIRLWRHSPGHREARARIGAMLQDGGLPRGVSARTALRYLASLFEAPLHVDALLERCELSHRAKTRVENLSGGEARRLAFAISVVGQPDLLFLDEPSAGLDPVARRAQWDFIEEIKGGGSAIVLTTHDLAEAERLADTIHILDRGALVASGTAAGLPRTLDAASLEDAFIKAVADS